MKYPRTFHIPNSPGCTSDDKIHSNLDWMIGRECVITEKMDGENTTMTSEHIHARSLDSRNHPSRNWVKQFHANIAHQISENFRICGENLYARHSLAYHSLKSFFYGFSVWNGETALSWDETLEWFELLGIQPVTQLYRGILSQKVIENQIKNLDMIVQEGFVIRLASSFQHADFKHSVVKYVRANHVISDTHWMHSTIIPNELMSDDLWENGTFGRDENHVVVVNSIHEEALNKVFKR